MTKTDYEYHIQTLCLAILTIIALAVAFYLLRIVLVPFILAAFLSLVLMPVVNFLMRKLRIGRPIALLLTLLLGFLALLAAGGIVSVSVGQFANSAREYEQQLTKLIAKAEGALPLNRIAALMSGTSTAGPSDAAEAPQDPLATESDPPPPGDGGAMTKPGEVAATADTPAPERPFHASMLVPEGAIKGFARRFSSAVLSILSNGLLVMLFTAFLLTGSTARPRETLPQAGVITEIESRVQKYILIKICSSMLTGFLVFLVLHFLGVRFAMSFGTFAFILNFIPNLGSMVSTLLPVPVVLLTPDVTWVTVVLAIALPALIQFTVGSVLEPKIMGDTLGLHPVVVLMSLIFWGMLWGFSGMVLAIPMTAIAKIVFERIGVTRPIAGLLEGRLEALEGM